ncbi:prophage tail fiber N-terminal domain-containing protein [Marinobacter salarius]|uniref:prophage tail fiber N-terminal domain-containing protein n=1 Tax=Marinobacter salarius TaxID=1420917 RepID=UPI003BA942F1
MAHINLTGTLRDAQNNIIPLASIKMKATATSNDVLQSVTAIVKTDSNGVYNFDLNYGRYEISIKTVDSKSYYVLVDDIIINSETVETDLNSLITNFNDTDLLTPEVLLEMRQLEESTTALESNAAESAFNASNSATAAATSETNASTSETNALASENAASTSESNAATSETNAAISETNSANSATAALASEQAAATSESNASTSETNALASEQAAATSASNAGTSETNAANSATASSGSASAAETSAGNAATSETNAATSASNAATSETNAAISESNASTSASNASISETNAAGSESAAFTSKNSAATSASNAATSETNSANSATAAATSETNAANSATAALTSEQAAATSETNAAGSETNALASEQAAATSASNAGTSETNAANSAQAASDDRSGAESAEIAAGNYASAAATSASNAATSETNAATSETNAANSEANAAQSATEAQQAAASSMTYKGTWDASTGVYPDTTNLTQGALYKVSVQGTVSGTVYKVGDQIIYNGTDWDHVDNTESVSSVAGKVGDITLSKGDVGLGNVRNVSSYSQTETDGLVNTKLDSTDNAVSASKLNTARNIGLSGVVSGNGTFDGTSNITINVSSNLSSDDLTEGATNLFYTDTRASSAAPVQSVNGATGDVVLNGDNFYLDGLTFNTGVLTASVNGATNQTVDLDGRYLELAGGTIAGDLTVNGVISGDGSGITGISTTDTNYYLNGLTFNTSSGVLTATVSGATNQTVDLDGRYLLSSGKASDSNLLDGLNSTQFLRSDISATANGDFTVTGNIIKSNSSGWLTKVDGQNVGLEFFVGENDLNLTSTGTVYIKNQTAWHGGNFDPDSKYDQDGGFIYGDVFIRNFSSDDTTLHVLSEDAGRSQINLVGSSQGTGRVFVGESNSNGGGIEYNGDNTPSTTGAGADYITLYRRSNSTDSWTAKNKFDSNDWEFRGDIYASGNKVLTEADNVGGGSGGVTRTRHTSANLSDLEVPITAGVNKFTVTFMVEAGTTLPDTTPSNVCLAVQMGDSGGFKTTNYVSSFSAFDNNLGPAGGGGSNNFIFLTATNVADYETIQGTLTFEKVEGSSLDNWTVAGSSGSANFYCSSMGSHSGLFSDLDKIRLFLVNLNDGTEYDLGNVYTGNVVHLTEYTF